MTGTVNYEPENHQLMTIIRRQKVEAVAERIPLIDSLGDDGADLLVLGWGGTCGAITTAVNQARAEGKSVAAAHLRYLNPLPRNLGGLLNRHPKILIPELNTGQLRLLIRGTFLVDARGLNKIQGRPFLIEEIAEAIDLMLEGKFGNCEFLLARNRHVRLDDQNYEYTTPPDGRR